MAGGKTRPNSFTNDIDLFDATDWYALPGVPCHPAEGISGAGIAQSREKLYIIAGFNSTRLSSVHVLDITTNVWWVLL